MAITSVATCEWCRLTVTKDTLDRLGQELQATHWRRVTIAPFRWGMTRDPNPLVEGFEVFLLCSDCTCKIGPKES